MSHRRRKGRPVYTEAVGKQRRAERQSARKPPTFKVYAGAECYIRQQGEEWRPYKTTSDRVFDAYAWRNMHWYGFKVDSWELKISLRYVHES
jgi:hypothetical protein